MFRVIGLLGIMLFSLPALAHAQASKIAELERKVRDAERQRDEARRERDNLKREKEQIRQVLEAKIRDLETKMKAATSQPDNFKREKDILVLKFRDLTFQLDNLKRTADALKRDKDNLQRDRDAERDNARREKDRADNLQKELIRLRKTSEVKEWNLEFQDNGKFREIRLDKSQQTRFLIPVGHRIINVRVNFADRHLSLELLKE